MEGKGKRGWGPCLGLGVGGEGWAKFLGCNQPGLTWDRKETGKSTLVSISRKWQSCSKFRPGQRRFHIALFFRKFHKVKFEICNKVKISIFRNQFAEILNQKGTPILHFVKNTYFLNFSSCEKVVVQKPTMKRIMVISQEGGHSNKSSF